MKYDSRLFKTNRGGRYPVLMIAILMGVIVCGALKTQAQPTNEAPSTYKKMSLEELMDIEVTSVSKTPEKLSETASAIQVITGEDIHRSGASSLPEALRLAPNLQIAQLNSYSWVIGARGFNGSFANKMLVLIDGRSVYTPLDAGVLWDVQNLLLEDVDRIEVISGPGGTLWGANAVNGVINITTKSAKDTQGLYVSGAGGSFLQDFGAVRYGDNITSNLFFRVYGERFDRNSTVLQSGIDASDASDMSQGGFRMDYYPSDVNTLTLQGDFYSGTEETTPSDSTIDGQNVLGRWTHTFSEDSDMSLQLYWDRTWRRDIPSTIIDDLNTYDLDFQHRFPIGDRNSIVWGAGYRLMQENTPTTMPNNPLVAGFTPQQRNMQLFSGFVQDEITLVKDRLKLTLGTKLEHNDFSGFEVQPSARLAWTPTERQTVWGAVSRAVRSPGRLDADYHLPKAPPYFIAGGPDFDSEKVIAYELGYRIQPIQKLSLSLAGFYNAYSDLYNVQILSFPLTIENGVNGQSWGAELSGMFQATDWWRLRGGYTYFHKDLWAKPGHVATGIPALGYDPQHEFSMQSIMDLPAHFQLDTTMRYVDTLANPSVASYVTFDVRLAWQFKHLELALVGQNLWDNLHSEFGTYQEIPRSIYGKVTWRF